MGIDSLPLSEFFGDPHISDIFNEIKNELSETDQYSEAVAITGRPVILKVSKYSSHSSDDIYILSLTLSGTDSDDE